MTIDIQVSMETISDGRTKQGSGLEQHIRALILEGYSVAIPTPNGARTFTDADQFSAWFGSLGS